MGQVEGVAHGADGGGVLLEQELEGGVLEERPPRVSGDGAGGVLAEQVLDVLGDELQPQPVLARPLCHRDHEGRSFGVLHDRPHLVDDQQAGLGVLGGCGPHRLGADHRGGGPQLGFEEPQVEDGDQGLVGQQVVALVGEQVAQAAGGEGPEQPGHVLTARFVSLQILVEVLEAGALPGLGVVARQGVVEGGAALRPETLADHHLDEAAQAADALEQLLRVALVDDEGVHALAGHAGGEHPPARGAGHVRVLALGVDDVGGHAPGQTPEHPQLGGKTLAAAGAGEDGGVRVEMGAVPGVVDHRGAGPHVDAVEGAPAGVQVGRREGEEPGDAGRVQAAPLRHGVQGQGQGREQPLALPEGQVVQLAEGRGEVGLGPLGHLLEGRLVLGVEGDGQGRVEEPIAAPLHLVAEPGHVLQGDLRLRGHGAPAFQGEGLGRLEADLLPLQRPGRLLRRYRADVDGQVHRRSGCHQPLEEAGGQRAGPLAQVEGARKAVADAHVAPAHLHLDGGVLVELCGGAAQGGRYEEHPKLAAPQGVDGQPAPGEQAAQLVDARELTHGVEAPVEDAVAGLQVGEQASKRLGRRLRLRGQVRGLGLTELVPQGGQARRVLAHQQLDGEVQGVERPGEGPQLRLVQLQPHHLAYAELHPVQAHRPVVLKVGEHEAVGQRGRRLGGGLLGLRGLGAGRQSRFRRLLRSGGRLRRPLPSASRDSFKRLLQWGLLLRSRVWGTRRCRCAAGRRRPWPTGPGPGRPPP